MVKILLIILIISIVLLIPKTKIPPSPFPYRIPQVQNSPSYLTALVGDSIINSLGENANQLRLDLIRYYPGHEFVNYNYGYPSTNIESLPGRLDSILDKDLDLVVIESFGYNPLSQYPLEKGLKIQTEILDKAVRKIIEKKPDAVIVFMTPIALNREMFGKGVLKLNQEQRNQWVDERIAYINNHTAFAKAHGIPIIDIYQKSLNKNGDGDLKYIDPKDHIHPSNTGITLISQSIADFIFQNKIFPQ